MATKRNSVSKKALELRPPGLRKNMLALLAKLRQDQKAQEAFVANPTKVITSQVSKQQLTTDQVSESNRLLFALIANDRMRTFFSKFEPTATKPSAAKEEFAAAFAKQIASLQDPNILVALVGNALVGNGIPGLSQVAYQCVCRETTGKQSTVCTPVAKNQLTFGGNSVDPAVVRSLSEAFVARAKALAEQGTLANLTETVG